LNDLINLLNNTDLSNTPFVVIGNEAITQVGGWNDFAVMDAIDYVKARTPAGIKFTTAESAGGQYFINNPSSGNQTRLGQKVDIIFANIFPYWEGVAIDQAVSQVVSEYNQLKATYPGKEVIISETGWPSAGPDFGLAHPSIANEQQFWSSFLAVARQQGIE